MAASERMLGQQGAMSPEEVDIVVSDLHLSAGERLRIRPRFSLGAAFRRILRRSHAADQSFLDRENKLEDFPYDDAFSRMLDRVREQYGTVPRIRLRLMGDCFDPLVIPWKGKFSDPPYEAIAARKMQHILKGHRAFFAALARFIRTPNGYLDIFVGNHDVFLVWPGVQRQIARWLAGNNEALRKKIRFIDQHKRFEDFHRGVLFYHGMNADAHNAVDPERVILRERLGVKRKIPVHNMPYGSYMVVDLVNRIKLRNPLVGRLRGREMWKTAAIHMWSWGIYAGFAMMLTFLRSHLFAISDIRRTRSVRQFFRMVYETCIDGSPERVDRMAEHILEDRPDVRVVVLGHSHAWRRISTPKGTYLNTGTWSLKYEAVQNLSKGWRRWARFAIAITTFGTALVAALFAQLRWSALPWEPSRPFAYVALYVLLAFTAVAALLRLIIVKPMFQPVHKLTFALLVHGARGELSADLMEYAPEEDRIQTCM